MRAGGVVGEMFDTTAGVQQGCLSGSWIFCLYIHFCIAPIMLELAELGVKLVYKLRDGRRVDAAALHLGQPDTIAFTLSVLFIVDDTTLVSDSVAGLRRALELV